jgi:hypothetical protein
VTRPSTRAPIARIALLGLATLVGLSLAGVVQAVEKSTQSEARWIKYDPAAKTVTLKIEKPGKGPNRKMMKRNKEVVFRVVPEGSVLKRTTVTINSQRAEMTDVPAGKKVNVYWTPDPEHEGGFFAKKIDVVLSEEELNKRYPDAE